jgi:hypothetical protein
MLLDRQGALEVYAELAQLYPDDVEVHQKRLDLYRKSSPVDGRGAARTIQTLAGLGVLDLEGLRFLQRWYAEAGLADGAFVRTELLAACGAATPAEVQQLRRHRPVERPADLAERLAREVADHALQTSNARGSPL